MKYLLKFNEASLSPDPHFSVDLSNIDNISDLKYRLGLKSVHIIPVEEVDKKYGSQFLSKSNICGIYGGFIGFENRKNIQNPKIIIAADEDILSNSLKDKRLFQIINNTIDHESVHLSQYKKAGNIYFKYNGLYHDNPREAMAYAKTAANKLIELFGKDESLNFLKCGGQITDEQIVFSKTNRKSYNRFLKYLYQYLK